MLPRTYMYRVVKPLSDTGYVLLDQFVKDNNGSIFYFQDKDTYFIIIQGIEYPVLHSTLERYKGYLHEYLRSSPDVIINRLMIAEGSN